MADKQHVTSGAFTLKSITKALMSTRGYIAAK